MSYNGSGTFQINTSGQPVVTGTIISSTAFNSLTADLATGLSTAITKDGQTATTVRIPFAQGISSTLATDSTSGSTGSIFTAGGVGITKSLFVGGTATFSATPIFSALTASSAVATDASKALVSVTNTGTGNNVLATNPTLETPNITSGLTLTSAAGTSGQVLTSAGSGFAPTWTTPSTASGTVTSVATGTGLTGGPITTTGTIAIDSTVATLTGTQTLTNKTLTTPNINSAQFATVSGTAPIYPCRAWVNFNGTGTVAIRASGNVSSITDNGVGDYTVNFTTAMSDANYSVAGTAITASGNYAILSINSATSPLTTAFRVLSIQQSGGSPAPADLTYNNVAVFR